MQMYVVKLLPVLAWVILLGVHLTAQNAPVVNCPKSVSVADPQLIEPTVGWEVFFDPVPHNLSRVTFFDGPVAENATLAPDSESVSGTTRRAKWVLQARRERHYWLACYYSATSLALRRALPAGLKGCIVTYNTSVEVDGMPEIKSLSCE
jgi:hypothetical protein